MTCLNPKFGYKKKFSSLTDTPEKYYADKKIKFKQPVDSENWEKIKIPCGYCLGCRLDKSNAWATRIMLESKDHKKNCFITLTYAPEHLPIRKNHMTLRKKDLQDFIKRLRYHTNKKISYFGCGELGGRTYRPHYHLILFGWEPEDLKPIGLSKTEKQMFTSKTLSDIWGNGFITVEELNYATACYTARYVQKKSGLKPHKRELTDEITPKLKIDERTKLAFVQYQSHYKTNQYDQYGREKEFIVMSKKPAIGLNYWKKNKDKIIRNGGIPLNINGTVKIKPIPRYFFKKWIDEDFDECLKNKYRQQCNAEKNQKMAIDKISIQNAMDKQLTEEHKENKLLEMTKQNLEFKARFLKRNQV